jgi:hypothetical protein
MRFAASITRQARKKGQFDALRTGKYGARRYSVGRHTSGVTYYETGVV